ncbi:MAG: VapC toxin family PIN domain ribonuclease, partial [Micrococcales bacterium]|nr:VapC toxin family PIN domain ribonuclease [Micrococcales bacterium]
MVFLVDANVLIAMSDGEHVHHDRAVEWFAGVESFATCPITEGALVRYLVREGTNPSLIRQALVTLASRPGHEFWADSLPYA